MHFPTGAGSSRSSGTLLGKALRLALAGGVAAAALLTASTASAATAADAAHKKPAHAKREAKKKEPPPKPLQAPLIEVSIADQRLTLYDKGEVVAHAPVSTGMAGHLTPTGVFSVLEKEVFHRSNIYSGAPMPFMQRITWSGVALHAGVLPGYPASHGCIRMPPDFAVKLFHMTERGARVLVVRNEVTPVPIESPRLFTRPKPAEKVSELVPPAAGEHKAVAVPAMVRVAQTQTQTPNVMTDAAGSAPHAAAAEPKPTATPAAPAAAAAAAPSPASKDITREATRAATANDAAAKADAPKDNAANAAPPAATDTAKTDTAKTDVKGDLKDAAVPPPAKPDVAAATAEAPKAAAPDVPRAMAKDAPKVEEASKDAAKDDVKDLVKADAPPAAQPSAPAAQSGDSSTGSVVVRSVVTTPPQPVEVQKALAPPAASAAPAPAVAPAPATAPAPVPTAAPAPVVAPAAPVVKASLGPYGPERPLRPGPITVFVSKKDGKLYIRKGFQPIFSAPVSILHPEQPLGTHLYTAIEQNADGVSFRWLTVSLPTEAAAKRKADVVHYVTIKGKKVRKVEKAPEPPAAPHVTAAEALDRIEIPDAARERISALMSTGASLIISDKGLGEETGSETDFIVVTSK